MKQAIEIKTRRYSTLARRILNEYDNIIVNMDGAIYTDEDIANLKQICTNKRLKATLDFLVTREDKTLFGFHDYPSGFFWANISELEFIVQLARENILRYRVLSVRAPLWQRLAGRLKNALLKIVSTR